MVSNIVCVSPCIIRCLTQMDGIFYGFLLTTTNCKSKHLFFYYPGNCSRCSRTFRTSRTLRIKNHLSLSISSTVSNYIMQYVSWRELFFLSNLLILLPIQRLMVSPVHCTIFKFPPQIMKTRIGAKLRPSFPFAIQFLQQVKNCSISSDHDLKATLHRVN